MAEGLSPIEPVTAPERSVRMSPKRLEATTTSKSLVSTVLIILYIKKKRERRNGRVRASGGSTQGAEVVRASEWVRACVGTGIAY